LKQYRVISILVILTCSCISVNQVNTISSAGSAPLFDIGILAQTSATNGTYAYIMIISI